MKNDNFTIIIPIRNRESWRIEQQVQSIRRNGTNPLFFLIDYGSSTPYKQQYEEISRQLSLHYFYMYAEGFPWNKCKAVNYGVRLTKTNYTCMSDVDALYESNVFNFCLDNCDKKSMIHFAHTASLNKNNKVIEHFHKANPGLFQFISRDAFFDLGGYDERIEYWGMEDTDWFNRLLLSNYSPKWLPDYHCLYHQWHEPSEKGYLRPIIASYNTSTYVLENTINPKLADTWGAAILKENRPILSAIEKKTPYDFSLEENISNISFFIEKILKHKKNNSFMKIYLGTRLKKRPLDSFRFTAKKIFVPLKLFGINPEYEINTNFDTQYAILPILKKMKLKDYYITESCDTLFLLW